MKPNTKIMMDRKPAPKKGTKLQQNLGVTTDEIKRCVDTEYVIDTNMRKHMNDKPRMKS